MSRLRLRLVLGTIGLVGLAFLPAAALAEDGVRESPDRVWTLVGPEALEGAPAGDARVGPRPRRFQAAVLDRSALDLAFAALASDPASAVVLHLPRPDGGFEAFVVRETQTMAPELAEEMRALGWDLRTFSGLSRDRPSTTVSIDFGGPFGFHAMVLSPDGTSLVDPYWPGDRDRYIAYWKRDLETRARFECSHEPSLEPVERGPTGTGGQLRTYRAAVAATGEYTAAVGGGTQAGGLAAITTTMNRVNQIYERDASIRFQLVAGNLALVYVDPMNDPYLDGDTSVMVTQNQTNLDLTIGDAAYDIGHVFGAAGSGGFAPGDTCVTGSKAMGATTQQTPPPQGDAFDVDFVAHEIGHQMSAFHTFNGQGGACAGAWTAATAVEPGSGTTIMAYAGICGSDNVQPNSEDDFHAVSLEQILGYANGGGACATTTSAGNPNPPTVSAGADRTIPHDTPFELTAQMPADADGDALTFSWEETDRGTQAPLGAPDDGVQPLFRAFPPTASPTRIVPNLDDLLAGTTPVAETLPTTNRSLAFRIVARDNATGGGRIGTDDLTLTVTTSAGPFEVQAPNGGETWSGVQSVTWDVAATDQAPVSAAAVDILLSTDGGQTFPTVLIAGTANDGQEDVTLPAIASSTARIKVKASDNVFFDLSDADFTLEGDDAPHLAIVLDRTGSMLTTRSSGRTRCEDALTLAVQDVRTFFDAAAGEPDASVAVWTFAGSSPTDLTGGFVDEATAIAALGTLSPTGCTGATPLADAICAASDGLTTAFPAAGPGESLLAISSDGGENNSSGPCDGPSSASGPPYDPGSWQRLVTDAVVGRHQVFTRYWSSVQLAAFDVETGEPIFGVDDALFFETLAIETDGEYFPVTDGGELPPPFFGPPVPGVSPLEIPTLGQLGLIVIASFLALGGLVTLRRRGGVRPQR